jgi:N-acetylglucosamine kinase-like BadF-type ATPase
VGVVVGVDGGSTKTDVLVVSPEGEPLAFVRGGGSNSHAPGGAHGSVATIAGLVARTGTAEPAEHGAFFLCGADVPSDIEALEQALAAQPWVRRAHVDNDTFALLRTGSDSPDAVAVVCGGGFNCVGRAADGRTARYPSLGSETGDWGGSGMLGREVLFHAARAEDGRGEQTVLVDVVLAHFDEPTVAAVGEAVHYRRLHEERLGELAPEMVAAAEAGDAVARGLIERLADEVALAALRSLRDLGLEHRPTDVVLGGGMLRRGEGLLHEQVVARLAERAPQARPVVAVEPPVLGAALEALDAAEAPAEAGRRLRAAFRDGLEPEDVR